MAQLVKNLPAMQETWVRSLSWEDPLEKGKATHFSILAWRIQSMGSQRVGHFHFQRASLVVQRLKKKVSACNVGDLGSIPGSGRSPGEGNGNPLRDCCLENPMDRGVWWWGGYLQSHCCACMHAKSLQLCLTLCDPMDCS